MSLGNQIRQKRKKLGLSADQLSELLGISKDKIYKWETGTKPSDAVELLKVQAWLSTELEIVPREKMEIAPTEDPYKEKYIALLEKENTQKDRIIDISLTELVLGNRISQAHLKTLLQITVVETAVMQKKDPVKALRAANKVVSDNFEAPGKTGS